MTFLKEKWELWVWESKSLKFWKLRNSVERLVRGAYFVKVDMSLTGTLKRRACLGWVSNFWRTFRLKDLIIAYWSVYFGYFKCHVVLNLEIICYLTKIVSFQNKALLYIFRVLSHYRKFAKCRKVKYPW